MAEVFDWNILAASNNNPPPNGWPENMEYDEVNDTGREVMAVIARFIAGINGTKTTGGTSTAYTLTSGYTLSGYAAGQMFAFVANADSTGSVTLNVNGLGAGNVVDSRGVQLGAGDIRNGGYYLVRRTSGGTFMVLGHLSSSSIASAAGVTLTSAYSAGGTGNAITITPSPAFTAYANGQLIAFIATANNTGAVTINISGLGAEALEDYRSAALSADDIVSGRWYLAGRVGGEWRILAGLPVDVANDVVGVLPIANGGTGGATASAAITALIAATSTVTAAPGDSILIGDVSDSGAGKDALVSTVGAGKHSIWLPAAGMTPGQASAPAAGSLSMVTNFGSIPYLAFDATAIEIATCTVAMPKGWNVGNLTAKVFWTHPATTTNFGVTWAVQAAAFGNDDTLVVNIFTGANVTDTGGTTSDLYVSDETGAIDPGNTQAAEDMLVVRIVRDPTDGGDTMAVDAHLIGVMLYYTTTANTDD